jgi:TonB family protein
MMAWAGRGVLLVAAATAVACAPVEQGQLRRQAGGANRFLNMASVHASLEALPDLHLSQAEVCALADSRDAIPALVLFGGPDRSTWRLANNVELTRVAPVIHCTPDRPAITVVARVTCDARRPVCTFGLWSGPEMIPWSERTYWFARRADGSLQMVASLIGAGVAVGGEVPVPVPAPTLAVDSNDPLLPSSEGGVVGGVIGGTIGGSTTEPERLPDGRIVKPFGAGMNRPTKISGREIQYLQAARDAGVQGTALVKCIIGVDGAVTDCKIIKGLPLMDAEILSAVSTWKMTPVLFDGAAVAVSYTIPIRLKLEAPAPPGWSIVAPGTEVMPFATGMNRPSKLAGRLPKSPAVEAGAAFVGRVRASCTIGPEGNLLACTIVEGSPNANADVLEALKAWRMTPVLLNGKPVAATYQFEFVFGHQTLPPVAEGTTRFQVSP